MFASELTFATKSKISSKQTTNVHTVFETFRTFMQNTFAYEMKSSMRKKQFLLLHHGNRMYVK